MVIQSLLVGILALLIIQESRPLLLNNNHNNTVQFKVGFLQKKAYQQLLNLNRSSFVPMKHLSTTLNFLINRRQKQLMFFSAFTKTKAKPYSSQRISSGCIKISSKKETNQDGSIKSISLKRRYNFKSWRKNMTLRKSQIQQSINK